MILAMLLLAAATAASPGPSLDYAVSRSVAYRECVAARRPAAASVAEMGSGPCSRARARLLSAVRDHVGYGWAATAKSDGQARRMRAQVKRNAEEALRRFERDVQAWLVRAGPPAEAGVENSRRTGSRPSPGSS